MLDKRDVAAAIRQLRGGRTQKDVAEHAGIDRPTWNQYEKAHAMPKRENFRKIIEGLGCTQREFDEAMIAAWRQRLDEEHPLPEPELLAVDRFRDSDLPEPQDPYHQQVRHHTGALAFHVEALMLLLRNEITQSS